MHMLLPGLIFAYSGFYLATGLVSRNNLAPLYGSDSPAIEGDYLVAFHDDYTLRNHWQAIGRDLSSVPNFTNFTELSGYGVEMDDDTLRLVRQDPGVKFVEHNAEIDMPDWGPYTEAPMPNKTNDHAHIFKCDYNTVMDPEAPYGLRMVGAAGKISIPKDKYGVPEDGPYDYLYKAGEGVNVYVFDTGIKIEDPHFQRRATNFGGWSQSDTSPYLDEVMRDEDGHGTHTAIWRSALANVINVKVLSNGTRKTDVSRMTKAVNDVIAEHKQNRATKKGFEFRGSVINMSLAGGFARFSFWFDLAIGSAHSNGITVVTSAGNDNMFAEYWYPCAYTTVICVAAVDREYKRTSTSNYGQSVDFTAPGFTIASLSLTEYVTKFMSGTSQAAAHVSGVAAIFISWKGLANDDAASYVWSNSLSGLTSGMGFFDRSTFANTGVHSPKKYRKEPFRWRGDNPAANPQVSSLNNTDVVSAATTKPPPLVSSLLLSTPFTSFVSTAPITTPTSTDTTVYSFTNAFSNAGNNATMWTIKTNSSPTAKKTSSPAPNPTTTYPTPSAAPQPSCFPEFEGHSDVHEFMQSHFASQICNKLDNEGHKIVKDDDSSKVHEELYYQNEASENAYVYDIYWNPGCTTDVSQRDAFNPMETDNYNCTKLLERDYLQCNNGGAGGKATVGCVTYEFSLGPKYSG